MKKRWKCKFCNLVFETRAKLREHIYAVHRPKYGPKGKGMTAWNKGLTKEIDKRIVNGINTLHQHLLNGTYVPPFKNKHLSEEHKQKVSIGMKKAHKERRAHNFAMTRRSAKDMSYPEKWFLGIIKNEFNDQSFLMEYKFFNKYSFDFAWIDKKKVIEVDGSQHYDGRFPERIQHDIERDIFVKSKGWQVLRLRWTYVLKQKKYWIKVAKRFIDG